MAVYQHQLNSISRSGPPPTPPQELLERTCPHPQILPRPVLPPIHGPVTDPLVRRNTNPLHHLPDILLIPRPCSRGNSSSPFIKADRVEYSFLRGYTGEDRRKLGGGEFGRDHGVYFRGGLAWAQGEYFFLVSIRIIRGLLGRYRLHRRRCRRLDRPSR